MGQLTGRRVADGDFFQHSEPEPGDYGRVEVVGKGWRWFVCLPNGIVGQLHDDHVVEENDDGTISVAPSIENRRGVRIVGSPLTSGPPITDPHSYWHGYLVDGQWRDAEGAAA